MKGAVLHLLTSFSTPKKNDIHFESFQFREQSTFVSPPSPPQHTITNNTYLVHFTPTRHVKPSRSRISTHYVVSQWFDS